MKKIIALLLVALLVTGCAGISDKSVMNIMDSSGKIVATIAGTAAQRDYFYTNMHIERDRATQEMYAMSGLQVKMEAVTLGDGSIAFLPMEFSLRGNPQFQQNLETRPPDHRAWDTADKFLGMATVGLGAYFLNDFGKAALGASRPVYNGPYAVDSYNSTAEPYFAPIVE